MDRAEEHLGPERAARYLRKFYPWYLERLEADRATTAALQSSDDLDAARTAASQSLGRRWPRRSDRIGSGLQGVPGERGGLICVQQRGSG